MPSGPLPRILIVDDEQPQMKALCDTLKNHEYETTGFSSGKDALAALRIAKFDLLLADLMMPEMSGIELLQAAQEYDPFLVGIIMTGQGTIETAVQAMRTGALDYVLKPFKLSAVLPVLARALAVHRLRLENAELQLRVQQRTAELEAANQELTCLNQELESFTYSVSHDLRSPLNAINGFSNMLLRDFADQMPSKAQDFLQHVVKSAQRMGQIIEDLLRLSRLGRQPLSKQSVDIAAIVKEVVDELQQAQSAQHIVDVRIDDLPGSFGDPSLLKQVFTNLLSNVFKFSGHKEQALVEVGCQLQNGDRVYFVRDNGAGFDMQNAQKLFGVFQRLHGSDEFAGTGVGLSIVQRIVQRHGGRIWAEAEAGKGAAFYFTLGASKHDDLAS